MHREPEGGQHRAERITIERSVYEAEDKGRHGCPPGEGTSHRRGGRFLGHGSSGRGRVIANTVHHLSHEREAIKEAEAHSAKDTTREGPALCACHVVEISGKVRENLHTETGEAHR